MTLQCGQRTHLPRPGRTYRHPGPNGRTAVLCEPCAASLNAMGMDWQLEPEPFVQEWRKRLPGRDETGRAVA